jgi:hypothetical protein
MRRLAYLCLFSLMVLSAAASASAQSTAPPTAGGREVLTNEAIISLAKAGFKERTILSLIRSSPTAFDLSTVKIIELKKRGVNERIILEMIERQSHFSGATGLASLRDDDFFTDKDRAFFDAPPTLKPPSDKPADNKSGGNQAPKENETQVFGSRSGNKSKSSTRGLGNTGGEREGESEVSASATVRLIKPPSEASSPPKLERAPKLDNQAILELVQAGFSEGTVLRKIETTQVEFDVSPKALTELRQNRVSERIIKAMVEAMDEGKK